MEFTFEGEGAAKPSCVAEVIFRSTSDCLSSAESVGLDLVEQAGVDVVHESADVSLCGTNGVIWSRRIDCAVSRYGSLNDSSAHHGLTPSSASSSALNASSVDALQAAVGVVQQDDLTGTEVALRQAQRTDHVVGDHAAGVADDVRLAVTQPEDLEDVHPRVHAGHDREVALRSDRQVAVGELLERTPRCWRATRRRSATKSSRHRPHVSGMISANSSSVSVSG